MAVVGDSCTGDPFSIIHHISLDVKIKIIQVVNLTNITSSGGFNR